MTIQATMLLRKLKKAQKTQDGQVYIDFEAMTVTTIHAAGHPYATVDIKSYRNSIYSILRHMKDHGYVYYDSYGQAQVTHAGWHTFAVTVQGAVKFTLRDIIVPIIVTVATTLLLKYI